MFSKLGNNYILILEDFQLHLNSLPLLEIVYNNKYSGQNLNQ